MDALHLNTLLETTHNQSRWIAEFQSSQPQILQATVKAVVNALVANPELLQPTHVPLGPPCGRPQTREIPILNSMALPPTPSYLPIQVCHGVAPLPPILGEMIASGSYVEFKGLTDRGLDATRAVATRADYAKAMLPVAELVSYAQWEES